MSESKLGVEEYLKGISNYPEWNDSLKKEIEQDEGNTTGVLCSCGSRKVVWKQRGTSKQNYIVCTNCGRHTGLIDAEEVKKVQESDPIMNTVIVSTLFSIFSHQTEGDDFWDVLKIFPQNSCSA